MLVYTAKRYGRRIERTSVIISIIDTTEQIRYAPSSFQPRLRHKARSASRNICPPSKLRIGTALNAPRRILIQANQKKRWIRLQYPQNGAVNRPYSGVPDIINPNSLLPVIDEKGNAINVTNEVTKPLKLEG